MLEDGLLLVPGLDAEEKVPTFSLASQSLGSLSSPPSTSLPGPTSTSTSSPFSSSASSASTSSSSVCDSGLPFSLSQESIDLGTAISQNSFAGNYAQNAQRQRQQQLQQHHQQQRQQLQLQQRQQQQQNYQQHRPLQHQFTPQQPEGQSSKRICLGVTQERLVGRNLKREGFASSMSFQQLQQHMQQSSEFPPAWQQTSSLGSVGSSGQMPRKNSFDISSQIHRGNSHGSTGSTGFGFDQLQMNTMPLSMSSGLSSSSSSSSGSNPVSQYPSFEDDLVGPSLGMGLDSTAAQFDTPQFRNPSAASASAATTAAFGVSDNSLREETEACVKSMQNCTPRSSLRDGEARRLGFHFVGHPTMSFIKKHDLIHRNAARVIELAKQGDPRAIRYQQLERMQIRKPEHKAEMKELKKALYLGNGHSFCRYCRVNYDSISRTDYFCKVCGPDFHVCHKNNLCQVAHSFDALHGGYFTRPKAEGVI